MLGIVLVIEVVTESIKKFDWNKKLKQWYSTIVMGLSLGLSLLSFLAAFLKGSWAFLGKHSLFVGQDIFCRVRVFSGIINKTLIIMVVL